MKQYKVWALAGGGSGDYDDDDDDDIGMTVDLDYKWSATKIISAVIKRDKETRGEYYDPIWQLDRIESSRKSLLVKKKDGSIAIFDKTDGTPLIVLDEIISR